MDEYSNPSQSAYSNQRSTDRYRNPSQTDRTYQRTIDRYNNPSRSEYSNYAPHSQQSVSNNFKPMRGGYINSDSDGDVSLTDNEKLIKKLVNIEKRTKDIMKGGAINNDATSDYMPSNTNEPSETSDGSVSFSEDIRIPNKSNNNSRYVQSNTSDNNTSYYPQYSEETSSENGYDNDIFTVSG